MDFTDRNINKPQQPISNNAASSSGKKPGRLHRIKNHRLLNFTYMTLLFSVTILIAGVALSIFLFDGNNNKENDLVDTSKYQAVFLNGGQVYFGKITDVNAKYMSLADIYYLTPNQAVQSDSKNQTASNNFTIRKLGCELHRPQDVMVINHEQIIFWENLKDDDSQSTVPGAIKELSKQPQNCVEQATGSGNKSDSSSTTTPSTTNSAAESSSSSTPSNSTGQ